MCQNKSGRAARTGEQNAAVQLAQLARVKVPGIKCARAPLARISSSFLRCFSAKSAAFAASSSSPPSTESFVGELCGLVPAHKQRLLAERIERARVAKNSENKMLTASRC